MIVRLAVSRELFIRDRIGSWWSAALTFLSLWISTSLTIVLFARANYVLARAIIGVVYNLLVFFLIKYKLFYEVVRGTK